jgi:hypothetical protein
MSGLFRIQHWPGFNELWIGGIILELIFIGCFQWEVWTSPKADKVLKIMVSMPYLAVSLFTLLFLRGLIVVLIIFILGLVYLKSVRKSIVRTPKDMANIQFDSI